MKYQIVWSSVITYVTLHTCAIYGFYLGIFAKFSTVFFLNIFGIVAGFGITAGVHRLWSHKSYNATLTMRIILMIFNTMSLQDTIYQWTHDHRLHHKFSDTEADPYNASNGLFFSHIGWLMVEKNEQVLTKAKTINIKDLESDSVVMFQKKYFILLVLIFRFAFPISFSVIFLGENLLYVTFLNFFSYTISLHQTWTINSLAHHYGKRPYNINMYPRDNYLVTYLTLGEGYHNFHHTYPYDYKGNLNRQSCNFVTNYIDLCRKVGMVTETKEIDSETRLKILKNCNETENSQSNFTIIKSNIYGIFIGFWSTMVLTILHNIYN